MHAHSGVIDILFVVANLVIAAGYGSIPFLVLPYIRLSRTALGFGGGFFTLCGLTHVGMAFGASHLPTSWLWTVEHVAQAVCTWGFIITFHLLLRRANQLRQQHAAEAAARDEAYTAAKATPGVIP